MKKLSGLFLLASLLLPFEATYATITSGTVTAPNGITNVAYSKTSSVSIRWSVVRNNSGGTPGTTITSTSATFTDIGGGTLLGTSSKALSKTKAYTGSTETITINETVVVPMSVVYKAYQDGLTQISYNRSFTDCPGTSCGNTAGMMRMTFNLSGSGSAAFGISSFSIRFEDDSVSKTVENKGVLHAVATIQPTRTGLIRGVWEVASSSTSAGEPVYRTLQLVSRQVSGNIPVQIRSKQLPTDEFGFHLVRFRMTEPELADQVPVLQYMVVQSSRETPADMEIIKPADGRMIRQDTLFQWQPMIKAHAYKLEFIDVRPLDDAVRHNESYKPVVGILMQTINNSTVLPENSWSRLQSGKPYWWHVTAIDKQGRIIGQSQWQEISVQ